MKVRRNQKTKSKHKSIDVKQAESWSQRTGVQNATHGQTVHTNGHVSSYIKCKEMKYFIERIWEKTSPASILFRRINFFTLHAYSTF